jgi:hypothetical protein
VKEKKFPTPITASWRNKMPKARRIDHYQGKSVFKIPVRVQFNDSQTFASVSRWLEIIAHSPQEAANYVVEALNRPETEVYAYGPQGGVIKRYIGYESSVWRAMSRRPSSPQPKQLKMELI